MFIAALFTVAKTWNQPKCPLKEEWIKRWYIDTMEYYSTIKKNETMPSAATWMNLEIAILREVKERNTIWYCLNAESKKENDTNQFIKTETDSTDLENEIMVTRGWRVWVRGSLWLTCTYLNDQQGLKKKKREYRESLQTIPTPPKIYIIKAPSSSILLWLQDIRREIQATHVEVSWMMRYQLERKATWRSTRL